MLVTILSNSLLVLILTVASSSRNTVEAQQQSSCNLECPSNAPCIFGLARTNMVELLEDSSPSPLEADNVEMHCDCPVGWTGQLCDVKFESCDTAARHECYHGGECVLGLKDEFGNEQLFCDCNNIVDGQFVGKYCETPNTRVQPDNFNEEGTIIGQEVEGSNDPIPCGDTDHICLHGGSCVEANTLDSDGNPYLDFSCDCTLAYGEKYRFVGETCELKILRGDSDPIRCGDDEQTCLHGGSCVETELLDSDTGLPFLDYSCDCSLAYGEKYQFVGETCELKILRSDSDPMPCGAAEHTCLHGGSCVETELLDSDGTSYLDFFCDCSLAYGDKYRFVGETCEIKKLREDSYDQIPCGDAEHTCLHGGSCVESKQVDSDGNSDYSCDCSLAYGDKYRFVGETCEIKKLREDSSDPIPCGDTEHICLHGGSYIETKTPDSDGNSDYSCDCSLAYGDKYRFVGETCEIKKLREDSYDPMLCGDAEHICLHGGSCVETELLDSDTGLPFLDLSCDCSLAYGEKYRFVGETCELKTLRDDLNGVGDTNVADNECVQQCLNGGTCTKGDRDVEFLHDIHLPTNTKKFLFAEFTSSDNWYLDANQKGHLAYCDCQKGWIGNTCEYPADVCEDNNVCLHGSKCGEGNLIDGYSCDCDESDLNCVLKMKGLKMVSDDGSGGSASIGMIVGGIVLAVVLGMLGIGIWMINQNALAFPPSSKNSDGVMNDLQNRDEEVDIDFENVDKGQIPKNEGLV